MEAKIKNKQVTKEMESFKIGPDSECNPSPETSIPKKTERQDSGYEENEKNSFEESNCPKSPKDLELEKTEVYPKTRGEREKKLNNNNYLKRKCERFGCPHRGLLKCSR